MEFGTFWTIFVYFQVVETRRAFAFSLSIVPFYEAIHYFGGLLEVI